jgi:hypothetical protein
VEEVVGWKGREGEKDVEGRRQRANVVKISGIDLVTNRESSRN